MVTFVAMGRQKKGSEIHFHLSMCQKWTEMFPECFSIKRKRMLIVMKRESATNFLAGNFHTSRSNKHKYNIEENTLKRKRVYPRWCFVLCGRLDGFALLCFSLETDLLLLIRLIVEAFRWTGSSNLWTNAQHHSIEHFEQMTTTRLSH